MLSIICFSDEINITNFSPDKKSYLEYMKLGNIYSEVHIKFSKMVIVLLALLLIKTKLAGRSTATDETCQTFNANQLQQVLELVLRPMKPTGAYNSHLDCADGKIRNCYPILCA